MNAHRLKRTLALLTGFGLLLSCLAAQAEGRLRIAEQFGISYLILDVVRDQKLIEKHGAAAGLDIKVEWAKISGVTAMNEALLSNNLDIVSAGVPPTLVLWDRTKGRQNVKAVAALGSLPNYLLSNNPQVKTIRDFSDKDRIAVPAAGVGFQSRTLQIETARLFGKGQFDRFDKISVSLPHPDATAALISGGLDINAHFSSAPYYYQALEANRAVHKVLSSYDVVGGPHTFNLLYTTQKYHDDNPKTYKALIAALAEAAQWIRANKAKAAETYIRQQHSRLSAEFIRKILDDPENDFTITPQRVLAFGQALESLGVIRNQATSWKDYFFDEVHSLPGS